MGADTKIEWAHHTYNPWIGCTRISPACDHCYAADWAKRYGEDHLWQGERRRTSAKTRNQPARWNREAEAAGERRRVFCSSLADVFDNQVPNEWRVETFDQIRSTPSLDWLLLTKRPQNIGKMLYAAVGYDLDMAGWPWRNVWLGTTIEDRKRLINLEHLRGVPAAIRFLSIEPLLEGLGEIDLTGIHLVIVGGESGPKARPMHPDWVRSLRDQCAAQGVAFFFKQWGEWSPVAFKRRGGLYDNEIHLHADGRQNGAGGIRTGGVTVRRLGKKAAVRLLDGVEHNAMPSVAA